MSQEFEITIRGIPFTVALIERDKPNYANKATWSNVSVHANVQYENQGGFGSGVENEVVFESDPVRLRESARILKELMANVRETEAYRKIEAHQVGVVGFTNSDTIRIIEVPPPLPPTPPPPVKKGWLGRAPKDVPVVETPPPLDKPLYDTVVRELELLYEKYGPEMPDGAMAVKPRQDWNENVFVPSEPVVRERPAPKPPHTFIPEVFRRVVENNTRDAFAELAEQFPDEASQRKIGAAREKLVTRNNEAIQNRVPKGRQHG